MHDHLQTVKMKLKNCLWIQENNAMHNNEFNSFWLLVFVIHDITVSLFFCFDEKLKEICHMEITQKIISNYYY